jgi:4-amino-4-deoxy-L-arabinose transferase-like glycosyltransferase
MRKNTKTLEKLLSTTRIVGNGYALLWTGMWLVMMAIALYLRPLLPVDETRYLAVAWEMWRNGNFLVPHLNGETYSHKPPLLFWLMHLGWSAFGVNDWWPRVVAPLFGLINLYLTGLLAQYLWPNRSNVAKAAPIFLVGSLFWTLFTTLTMFDMLLTFCALLAMIGIIRAWENDQPGSLVLLALAIGIGLLTKGPAVLLTTLPVSLFVPFWTFSPKIRNSEIKIDGGDIKFSTQSGTWSRGWKRWYFGVGLAFLGGVVIALLWAIPAAASGGEAYSNAIFWGQSAGRMVNSFAHARPWWWFIAVLPALILPWTIWPASWRALGRLRDFYEDKGIRFCLVWFLPALITFSIISGKQLHYLLPIFPALALIGSRLIIDYQERQINQSSWKQFGLQIPAVLFLILGVLLYLAPSIAKTLGLHPIIQEIELIWGMILALFAGGLILGGHKIKSFMNRIACLASLSVTLILVIHLSLKPVLNERYDLDAFSKKIRQWQDTGISLAYLGKYHGMFNFMGRLDSQITPVGLMHPDLENWQKANPKGYLIVPVGRKHEQVTPIYIQPFRGRRFIVITVAQSLAHPEIIGKP